MKTTTTIFTKLLKKICLLFLLSILSLNLFCQINWTKHPDNPVLTEGSFGEWDETGVAYPQVIYHNSTYHMWYQGSRTDTTRIGHATSPDGITWTKDSNNPVLDVGPDGAWDDQSAYFGSVLLVDDVFHMWYNGDTTITFVDMNKIGHATSPDGITWTKDQNNPVLTTGPSGAWDDTWSYYCDVVYTDGTFHMWYSGYDGSTGIRIGHATSLDGVDWTKDSDPVLTASEEWESTLIYSGGTIFDGSVFHMWYSAGPPFECIIGYATSEDGSHWEKNSQPVLEKGPAGSWESQLISEASVLFDSTENKYKMWYDGSSASGPGNIGYAESEIVPSVGDYVLSGLSVYPNPTNNIFTLDPETPIKGELEIYNLNGQLIHRRLIQSTSEQIDISSFSKGVYFVTVRSEEWVRIEKIIKL